MHAFGYGLPVVIHGDILKHGPEFGAFIPGQSGLVYENGNISQLSRAINHLLKNSGEREKMKSIVLKTVREKYNVDVMVNRFIEIAKYAYSN
jgi:glycosyltransferase involved in cell wall biosynthesis